MLSPCPVAEQFQAPGTLTPWNSCFGSVRTPGQTSQALGAGGILCPRGNPGCVRALQGCCGSRSSARGCSCSLGVARLLQVPPLGSGIPVDWLEKLNYRYAVGMLVMQWRDVLVWNSLVLLAHTRCYLSAESPGFGHNVEFWGAREGGMGEECAVLPLACSPFHFLKSLISCSVSFGLSPSSQGISALSWLQGAFHSLCCPSSSRA